VSAFTLVVSLLSALFTFATWMSLPFMSSFPHVIPLYIVGSYVVISCWPYRGFCQSKRPSAGV
jgi:hypothetical protein